MSLMRTCVQIEEVSLFIDIHKRNHVGPTGSIGGPYMSHSLSTEEFPSVLVQHLAIVSNHTSAMLLGFWIIQNEDSLNGVLRE